MNEEANFNSSYRTEGIRVVRQQDIFPIEQEALEDYKLKIMPTAFYKQFNQEMISQFCVKHAFYLLPTVELVTELSHMIKGKHIIEIGSGCGALGKALDITMTDNYQQQMPKYKDLYKSLQQTPIKYSKEVIKCDALEAVKRFKPEVVLASWVTHKYNPKRPELGGNEIGIDEIKMFKRIKEYIFIGNENVHRDKPLFHETEFEIIRSENIVSRTLFVEENCIFHFKR